MGASMFFRTTLTDQSPVYYPANTACRSALLSADGTMAAYGYINLATTFLWELISEPVGSAVVITPTGQSGVVAELSNITKTGGYLLRLTTDAALPTKDIQTLYFGVPLPNSGLCIPALNETTQDNIDSPPGYQGKLDAFLRWCDANAGGGSPVPVGTPFDVKLGFGTQAPDSEVLGTFEMDLATVGLLATTYKVVYTMCPVDLAYVGGYVVSGEYEFVVTANSSATESTTILNSEESVAYVPEDSVDTINDINPMERDFIIRFNVSDLASVRTVTISVLFDSTDTLLALADWQIKGTITTVEMIDPDPISPP